MDIESEKKSAYLDEYRIIRTLGAGYHAEYLFNDAGSSWESTSTARRSPSRNTKKKRPPSRRSSTSSES
jgi:hypothetical protein